jgi:hypothetical protein
LYSKPYNSSLRASPFPMTPTIYSMTLWRSSMIEFVMLLAIPTLLVLTVREALACLAWASEDPMDNPEIQELAEWAGWDRNTGTEAKEE